MATMIVQQRHNKRIFRRIETVESKRSTALQHLLDENRQLSAASKKISKEGYDGRTSDIMALVYRLGESDETYETLSFIIHTQHKRRGPDAVPDNAAMDVPDIKGDIIKILEINSLVGTSDNSSEYEQTFSKTVLRASSSSGAKILTAALNTTPVIGVVMQFKEVRSLIKSWKNDPPTAEAIDVIYKTMKKHVKIVKQTQLKIEKFVEIFRLLREAPAIKRREATLDKSVLDAVGNGYDDANDTGNNEIVSSKAKIVTSVIGRKKTLQRTRIVRKTKSGSEHVEETERNETEIVQHKVTAYFAMQKAVVSSKTNTCEKEANEKMEETVANCTKSDKRPTVNVVNIAVDKTAEAAEATGNEKDGADMKSENIFEIDSSEGSGSYSTGVKAMAIVVPMVILVVLIRKWR